MLHFVIFSILALLEDEIHSCINADKVSAEESICGYTRRQIVLVHHLDVQNLCFRICQQILLIIALARTTRAIESIFLLQFLVCHSLDSRDCKLLGDFVRRGDLRLVKMMLIHGGRLVSITNAR